MISDTDHYAPGRGDALWARKSFLRGHHPILMDFGHIGGVAPADPSAGAPMSFEAFEAARYAMGDTLRYARKMNLLGMEPRGDLSSTGYALADPGAEYLVLQASELADPFDVTVDAGTYRAEWFSLEGRETVEGDDVSVDGSGTITLTAPFDGHGPVVVHLRRGTDRS